MILLKNILLAFLFWIGLVTLTKAQVVQELGFLTKVNYLHPEEAPYQYLLANNVNMRSEPDKEAKVVGVLSIGTAFRLLEKSEETLTINGLKSHWYEVKLRDSKSGWIWGGFIAQDAFGSVSDPDVKFVGGYDRVEHNELEPPRRFYQIRAFKNGKELDKVVFESPAWEFGELVNIGVMGLDNVDDILVSNIPCTGGCGCLTGGVYIFWNDDKFRYQEAMLGTPDGIYSVYEAYIFPSSMEGIAGLVIKEETKVLELEPDAEREEGYITRELTQRYYEWDGRTLREANKEEEVNRYKVLEEED